MSNRQTREPAGLNALHELLTVIIQKPNIFKNDLNLRHALHSQGGFASLEYTFKDLSGIQHITQPMSLNTLKSYANSNLGGGFKKLDELRRMALDKLQLLEKPEPEINKRTKIGLTGKVVSLEHELEMHRQANEVLVRALTSAMHGFLSIRDADEKNLRDKRAQDALQELRAITSMNIAPFNVREESLESMDPPPKVADISIFRKSPK